MSVLLLVLAGAAAEPAAPVRLTCKVMLMTAPGQFTAPSPVTVDFSPVGKELRDIRVVDAGAILFPGAQLKMVTATDATRLDAVAAPAERPGRWSGKVEKTMYRLRLDGDAPVEWATIAIGRAPASTTGRFGLVWNASHQPEGFPRPMIGSGGGQCASAPAKDIP